MSHGSKTYKDWSGKPTSIETTVCPFKNRVFSSALLSGFTLTVNGFFPDHSPRLSGSGSACLHSDLQQSPVHSEQRAGKEMKVRLCVPSDQTPPKWD